MLELKSGSVSASTQNQAFSAILFLYRIVFQVEIKVDAVRATKPARLPVVLSPNEIRRLLQELPLGPVRIMAGLMYGAGERWRFVGCEPKIWISTVSRSSFAMGRATKTARFHCLAEALERQVLVVEDLHRDDLDVGAGFVWLPDALARKYPQAARLLEWQYLFPANKLSNETRPV